MNLNDKQSKVTHCVSLFIDENTILYFGSLGTEYVPQQVLGKFKDTLIIQSINQPKKQSIN